MSKHELKNVMYGKVKFLEISLTNEIWNQYILNKITTEKKEVINSQRCGLW